MDPTFPFASRPGVTLDPDLAERFRGGPLLPVRIRGGHPALLVTGHADVRTVLSDPRFSRQAWHGGTMFARKPETLALVTSDPPVHTRRRSAAQAAFTHRRAEADRPHITRVAEELLDALQPSTVVDLVGAYLKPLPYRVVGDIVGVPREDLPDVAAWTDVLMSAGRCTPEEVTDATKLMHAHFAGLLAERRAAPRDDLLSTLATAAGLLSDDEIVVLAYGLVMAGGEATASHLSSCALAILQNPALRDRLAADPALIPAAVEELLRWVWFAGTGGQPHVVLDEVTLAGVTLQPGQVVVPLNDAANQDPAVFAAPAELRPDRSPNPHLGFGHGRHMCLGAPHARVELQVALQVLLRRHPRISAAGPDAPQWRDGMFLRGLWQLPVHLDGA